MVYNGKTTQEWLTREYLAITTEKLESFMLTAIFDSKEERDIMSAVISNAHIQTKIPDIEDGE